MTGVSKADVKNYRKLAVTGDWCDMQKNLKKHQQSEGLLTLILLVSIEMVALATKSVREPHILGLHIGAQENGEGLRVIVGTPAPDLP